MIPVQIRFTRKLIEYLDRLIESGVYSNRSEAIRDATRRLVMDMHSRGMGMQIPGTQEMLPEKAKGEVDERRLAP
jgi:Arc/MetJ-type ribon-helix-helix transcriptional regulator